VRAKVIGNDQGGRLWRYKPTGRFAMRGNPPTRINEARMETLGRGARCDWAIGGVYEHLGMIEVRDK
jgi:hypothetical protein